MAHSMKLSKSSCMSSKRCEALMPTRSAIRAPSSKAVASRLSAAPVQRQALGTVAPTRCIVARASPAEAAPSTSAGTKQWYALVANAEFFLNDVQNESVAEQLRERVRFFKETNREIDFWLVPEPVWLDTKYPNEAKMVGRPCVALVSTDELWITFMKLRLDRVLRFNLGAVAQGEALAVGGKIPEFKKPEKWTAPYAPYSEGWWNVFLP